MNESDQIRDLLRDGVPPGPSTRSWAQLAQRASTRRRAAAAGVVVAVAALAAVGAGFMLHSTPPQVATPAPTAPSTSSAPAPSLVVAESRLIGNPGEAATFCTGIVLQLLPPSCPGVEVRGDFSWESVQYKEANGVRYTDLPYRLIGFLDLSDGERGVFTVTEPVEEASTSAAEPPRNQGALCNDPLRDAEPAKAEDSDQDRLWDGINSLPVVSVWVSEGRSEFNVVVRGDSERAFKELRRVWGGGLCVTSSDKSTKAERVDALERVRALLPKGQFILANLDSGEDLRDPILDVHVLKLDPRQIDELETAAGPGIKLEVTEMFTEYVR